MIKTDPAIGRIMLFIWIGIALLILGFGLGVVFPAVNYRLFTGPHATTEAASVVRISQFGFFLGGVGLCFMTFGAIKLLIFSKFSSDHEKPQRTIHNGYVIAKVCENEDKQLVYDPDAWDPLELTYYVQVAYEGGREEFETGKVVFDSIAEGATGHFVVQGKWLCSFTFVPRAETQ